MSIRVTLKAFSTTILLISGCSDHSTESDKNLQVWRAMVMQAEQMRTDELQADTQLLDSLKKADDSAKFKYELEKICRKWSTVERLSPVPVDIDYVPELIPIPAELPCSELEAGEHETSIKLPSLKDSPYPPLSDTAVSRTAFRSLADEKAWLKEMSRRLAKRMPNENERLEFLTTLHWEASRAGIDPQLMLGLIQVESGFRQDAVSPDGERGYTQVSPSWVDTIGSPDHNLFHLRTNLRYGAVILRHYIDIEEGDIFRALGRYKGTVGQPEYPSLVVGAWKNYWDYSPDTSHVQH